MIAGKRLKVGVFTYQFDFPLPDVHNTVLGIVTINDGDIVSLHVMQVACDKYRYRSFPMPPFCVANATKISLLIIVMFLIYN